MFMKRATLYDSLNMELNSQFKKKRFSYKKSLFKKILKFCHLFLIWESHIFYPWNNFFFQINFFRTYLRNTTISVAFYLKFLFSWSLKEFNFTDVLFREILL